MLKPRLGLRSKLLLVTLILLGVPWAGLSFVREMERYLRLGHEQSVAATAQAVATALHDRPQLFEAQAGLPSPWQAAGDLYLFPLPSAIELDGADNDWPRAVLAHRYPAAQASASSESAGNDAATPGAHFDLRIGQYGAYLYALLHVSQAQIHYRTAQATQVETGDHVELAYTTPEGEFRRYAISPLRPGSGSAYNLHYEDGKLTLGESEPRIRATWRETQDGYALELALPLSFIGEKLAFGVMVKTPELPAMPNPASAVIDTPTADNDWISTSTLNQRAGMGSLIIPSPEIQQMVQGLARATSRIRVLDKNQRVIAETGSLVRAQQAAAPMPTTLWGRIRAHTLGPLYACLLTPVSEDFKEDTAQGLRYNSSELESALRGVGATGRRHSADGRAVIVASAYPVWTKDQVLGAVMVEESTNAILTLRNQALTSLMNSVLAVFAIATVVLLSFASRLSYRIRKLRDEAEAAIDDHGRLQTGLHQSARAQDEIGDLSRGISAMLRRLSQHQHYLENLASRLSHELRTPITVVRSSLDNLQQQPLPQEAAVYMQRAQQGLQRLSRVLTRMTEARQLEQVLQNTAPEKFDLAGVIESCMAGYRDAYPHVQFNVRLPAPPLTLKGEPDLIAQMLDKLIANALDFHTPATPIDVALTREGEFAQLSVANEGPALPADMAEQLFFSMVSIRPPAATQSHSGELHSNEPHLGESHPAEPHLGLGLYIVRLIALYHGGKAWAANRADGAGVVLRVNLALASPEK